MAEEITITPEAAVEILRIKTENQIPNECSLRLGVKESGCCGKSYFMAFDDKTNENDRMLQLQGLSVAVDAASFHQMTGAMLGFDNAPESRGFYFTNPNDEAGGDSCGCGDEACGCGNDAHGCRDEGCNCGH
ncbi:MAG TPA: iron-sulfur cluster assembly accessory protein [Bacteroidota bacterium]|nr:iron-sulfur cluster assembly accessory protein [Bacteroidota bacterium]